MKQQFIEITIPHKSEYKNVALNIGKITSIDSRTDIREDSCAITCGNEIFIPEESYDEIMEALGLIGDVWDIGYEEEEKKGEYKGW